MSQNLSPFYGELFVLLKKNALEQASCGASLDAEDPILKEFQHAIDTAPDPLEVVERYHGFFGDRGAVHLEKKLMEAFLDVSHVRMYRGLPRLFLKNHPARSIVQKHYAHLPTLKRRVAEKQLFGLYSAPTLYCDAKISVFSWISAEDQGEERAGLALIETLIHQFPEVQICWIVLVPKQLGRPLDFPKHCKTHCIAYETELSVSVIDRGALEILRTSDCVLQTAPCEVWTKYLEETVRQIPFQSSSPSWLILEKGISMEAGLHTASMQFHATGLHFLEKGILFGSLKREKEFENPQLLSWMFASFEAEKETVFRYKQERHFYFASLKNALSGAIYIHAIVKACEKDGKNIDICLARTDWLLDWIALCNRQSAPLFVLEGVAVDLYSHHERHRLFESGGQKTIRLFAPSFISIADQQTLMQWSEPFPAVSDPSLLSDAILLQKAYFYDGHLSPCSFLKDLIAIAENRISAHSSALNIFRLMGKAALHNEPALPFTEEWVDESAFHEKKDWLAIAFDLGRLLQESDWREGFKKLNQVIAVEHRANEFIGHWLQRELRHRNDLILQQKEKETLRRFSLGEISFSQLLALMQKEILL